MTRETPQVDFEAALQDPPAFFAEPQDVADYPQLSREEKLAILRRWEQDALRLSESESEGMGGGEENMIGRVKRAIQMVRQELRWSPSVGQFGGLDKLGSGCRQAANFSVPVALYASSGVRPASIEWGRRVL